MKIHEYQAKQLLAAAGVKVPRNIVAHTADEAAAAYQTLGGAIAVVKSQIHAGGRGKGTFNQHPEQRGVVLVKSAEAAKENAARMLGSTLVTIQTGPEGKVVNTLLVEEGLKIARELYLGVVVDRESGGPILIASTEGGMDIEVVAHHTPEKILREPFDVEAGLRGFQARNVAYRLGLEGPSVRAAEKLLTQLCKFFIDRDCSMVEINPLVVTKDNKIICLDAKIDFDGNALYRHADIVALRDLTEEDEKEVEASKFDLNYIALDGSIGCMVNGAGLAMASMDIIKLYGSSPANFLDVGGSATKEKVTAAFKIITSDPNVKGILVNIFGGIMKCDVIAEGVVAAVKEVGLKVPLVVRLEGTNVELGKKIIKESGLNVTSGDDLDDAAQKIVKAVKEAA